MTVDHEAAKSMARLIADCNSFDARYVNLARAYLALTTREPLTKRLREIYDFLVGYVDQHGYSPTFVEIGHQFGYSSLSTVHEHLANLERKGWIRRSFNETRGITLTEVTEVAS